MKIQKIFRKTLFAIFSLFAIIGISTSALSIYTVDDHLSKEYESNSLGIAKTIADASVDIILNRDLSALQSLVDQFVEIQGISYIYVTNEHEEFLAHTFVPGIPKEILESDLGSSESVERTLQGLGDFLEVSSPILGGVAGKVHIGMDTGLITLKIQRAVGQQVYLISIIFVLGVLLATWMISYSGRPLDSLMSYAQGLANSDTAETEREHDVVERNDEYGQLARLLLFFSNKRDKSD